MKKPLDYERLPQKKRFWDREVLIQAGEALLGIVLIALIIMLLSWWKTGSPLTYLMLLGGS